jgi:serine/threonine protein phosphatase 1
MSKRPNVIPIMGNHEYYALEMLSKLFVELRDGDFSHLSKNEAETLAWELEEWCKIGGLSTLEGFQGLTQDERVFLLEYMEGFALYVKLAVGGQKYILTHSGVPDGASPGTLCFFDPYDFSIASADYKKAFADDVILVTGHRSTCSIDENSRGRIFHTPGHIAIDIGIAYENAPDILGCICLETGEEFYV